MPVGGRWVFGWGGRGVYYWPDDVGGAGVLRMRTGMIHAMSETTEGSAAVTRGAAGAGSRGGLWAAAMTLWRRELVRFFRQKNRVVSALVTPVLLWVGLGAGLDRALVSGGGGVVGAGDAGVLGGGVGYMAYFFPGTLSMIVLFTAVFSTIGVIEDRREGFMQGVLVAPIPRLSIVLGKVFGGASIAMIQACVFMLLWPFVGSFPGVGAVMAAVGVLALSAIAMTAMGLCIAWPMNSTAGFHAVMMLVLMPMWFLSGALFPVSTAMPWLRYLMWANPLTYGQAVLSRMLLGHDAVRTGLALSVDVALMLLFAFGALALAVGLVGKPRRDGM
jgi:ABC-2 type transport system permease protein